MQTYLADLIQLVATQTTLIVLLMTPVIVIVRNLYRCKRRQMRKTHVPFLRTALRPPGESLRVRLEAIHEKREEEVGNTLVYPLLIAAAVGSNPAMHTRLIVALGLAVSVGLAWYRGRILWKMMDEEHRVRLDFEGQRAVGEVLNQLMRVGYEVFHDLPFDGFNVDHVIVGRAGVFAIATRTRRKSVDEVNGRQHRVRYDGTSLQWPGGVFDTDTISLARRNSATVCRWLTSATGTRTPVQAVIAVPGWWVDVSCRGEEIVLNESMVWREFSHLENLRLSEEQARLVTQQLRERCRLRPSQESPVPGSRNSKPHGVRGRRSVESVR